MGRLGNLGTKMMKSDNIAFTFLRSAVSSQAASWVDMLMSFALFAWLGLPPWLATAFGAIAGGAINCIINYRFTFHADGCPWKAVIVKYTLVWVGSLTLNSLGTEYLYVILSKMTWLEDLGFRPDGYFAAARIIVSLIVSWAWNFVLQRNFVYRITRFDDAACKLVNFFIGKKSAEIEK